MPRAKSLRYALSQNPHPSATLRAGFLAQRTREKRGTPIFTSYGVRRPMATGLIFNKLYYCSLRIDSLPAPEV